MKVVWVNGCFDILHRGHLELLKYARGLGDQLVVGIDTDEKVQASKGEGRPFNNLSDRAELLRAIKYVDRVVSFSSKEGLENIIKEISPDILVVGSDWENKEVVGSQHAGKVLFFDRIPNYSTTRILEK